MTSTTNMPFEYEHPDTTRQFRFSSAVSYEAAVAWIGKFNDATLIAFYAANDTANAGEIWADEARTELVEDWRYIVMEMWDTLTQDDRR